MNNTKVAKLTPGDGTLTRRVKRRCKEIGFYVKEDREWNGYGYEIVAYHVPADILAEEESRRDAELEKKAEAERSKAEAIWKEWCQTKGAAIALADAVRFANRLQKVKRHPTFYSLKDDWIRRNQVNLVEGRRSRKETRTCWGCDGSGTVWGSDYCDRCDGTGIYSQRTLYEHEFSIEGKSYVFHSYVKPKSVSNTPGSDQAVYGRPFAANELPLPPQSTLVAMVEMGLSRPA